MKKRRLISLAVALFLTTTIALPVLAATAGAAIIETPTDVLEGIGVAPNQNTFYAAGRHWEMYLNAADGLAYRSSTNGVTWSAETVVVANTNLYGPEFSLWYDAPSGTVHYVRHDLDVDDTLYRMGTPAADGVITWAAAEQKVDDTPGTLVTFRVDICCDIDGYPWVVWVDDDGVGEAPFYGIVYIKSSSTKNGTWTEDASATIEPVGYKVWFANVIPVQEAPYARVEVHYSMEDIDGDGLGDVALMAANDLDDFVEQLAIASAGNMNATRPDAFASINNSAAVTAVYARADGDVMVRTHSAITTWATADAASEILTASLVSVYLPSLSAYATPLGYSFMCIVNDDLFLKYATHPYGGDWTAFTTLWQVPDPDNDVITRHNANYIHNGGITGFSWQVSYDDGDPAEYDTVYYWWYDTAGGFGYYLGSGTASWLLVYLVPISIAIGLVIFAFGAWGGNPKMAMIGVAIGIAGFIMVQAMLELV